MNIVKSFSKSEEYRRIKLKKSMLLYIPLTLTLLSALFVWHQVDKRLELERWAAAEARVRDTVSAKLTGYIHEVLGDLLILSEQHHLFDGTAEASDKLAENFARIQRVRRSYLQMRFIDTQGDEVVRVNYVDGKAQRVAEDELQNKAHRPYMVAANRLHLGEVFISRIDLNIEHKQIEMPHKPVIRFAIPVFDTSGVRRGSLLINYQGDKLLEQVAIHDHKTGAELMLLNVDGYWLYGPDPANNWGFQLPNGKNILQDHPQLEPLLAKGYGQLQDDTDLYEVNRVGVVGSLEQDWLERYTPTGRLTIVAEEGPWRLLSRVKLGVFNAAMHERLVMDSAVVITLLLVLLPISLYWGGLRARELVYARRISQLVSHIETVRERERASFARDIHDELGGALTALLFDIDLQERQSAKDNLPLQQRYREMRGVVEGAIGAMRRIITSLRPAILDDLGLYDAIEWQLEEFEKRTGISCKLDRGCDSDQVSITNPDRAVAVFRIVQEGLTNILRHAHATEVQVSVGCVDGKNFDLVMEDNGRGAALDELFRSGHYGILGMQERVRQLGGNLEIASAPGKGTRLRLRIPMDGEL